MFGTFRFILATMVVLSHIGGVEIVGGIAVWSFFMISGYLMTLVLNNKYGLDLNGLKVFTISRIIRLYPMYWYSIIISFILILLFENDVSAQQINVQLKVPTDASNILSTIIILGTTFFGIDRPVSALSPSVWAVDIELVMYFISCIYLSRSYNKAKYLFIFLLFLYPFLWFIAKYFIGIGQFELGNQLIYSFILAALIPYSTGALLYYKRDQLSYYLKEVNLIMLISIALLIVFGAVFWISKYSVTMAYLFPMPIIAVVIIVLSKYREDGSIISKVDNYLGLMSYPIYLLHWLSAYGVILLFRFFDSQFLISSLDSNDIIRFNFFGFIVVTISILLFSIISVHVVEKPIDRIRKQYKKRELKNLSF